MDRNRDGYLDINDLKKIFEELEWSEKYDLNEVLSSMDLNKDGRVCFEGYIDIS